MMLTFLLTTIIVSAWLIKMITKKKFIFQRTILDIPLILFLISQIISTIYSLDRHTSFWGYYSRFNGGLFSTITYLLLYWAFVSNLNKKKTLKAIRYSLYSTALVALYGLAEHFGIDAQYWVQKVQERVFSTMGQPNWLAAWLVALIPLSWVFSFINEKKKKNFFGFSIFQIINLSLGAIFFLCLLYTKSRSGLMGLAGAYLAFWGLIGLINRKKIKALIKPFITINFILIFLTVTVGTPWTPHLGQILKKFSSSQNQTQIVTPSGEETTPAETETAVSPSQPILFISESGDIRKIVWQGAIKIWQNYPIFGTGVETFGYSYYWHRPREHNDVSEWDLLYNKAHNEYLTILANTGLFGLATYLGIISTFLGWTAWLLFKQKLKENFLVALSASYVSILITNFFGFSVVAVNLLFFLIPALAITFLKEKKEAETKEKPLNNQQKTVLAIVILLTLVSVIYLAKFWYADTRFALAEKLNDSAWYENAYQELQTAIRFHPSEPYYHNEMASTLAGLAILATESEDASLSSQLAELAMAESDQALKTSPYHLNFWKNRAKMFITLTTVDPNYQQSALDTLLQAAELAPTDAKIFYNLGLLYSHLNQQNAALETMEKTVELKPNYANARYALALFYQEEGKIKAAREQLEYILEKINPADTQAKNKLKEL